MRVEAVRISSVARAASRLLLCIAACAARLPGSSAKMRLLTGAIRLPSLAGKLLT